MSITVFQVTSGLDAVTQWLNVLLPISAEFLNEDQKKYLNSTAAGLGIVTQLLKEQTNIQNVTLADLDAEEILIVAEDLRVQAQAKNESP